MIHLLSATMGYSPEQQALLEQGEVVWSVSREESGWIEGRAAVVVEATSTALLEVVSDYSDYVLFLPYVTASATVREAPHEQGWLIESSYELTTRGVTTSYRLESILVASQDSLRFRYLEGPGSIEEGGGGIWRVQPWEDERRLLELTLRLPDQWWLPRNTEDRIAALGIPRLVRIMGNRAVMLSEAPSDHPTVVTPREE